MVNFDKLGARVGQDNYTIIDGDWDILPSRKKKIIRALILNPEKSQKEIADIAGTDGAYVHNVIYSLPVEMFQQYQMDVINETALDVTSVDHEIDDHDRVEVVAPMQMEVTVRIPRGDLTSAVIASMRESLREETVKS